MSTSNVYHCLNPGCDAVFLGYGYLSSHMKMKPDCARYLRHMQEVRAGKERAPEPSVVPGSIHDMTAAHFAPEDGDEDDGIDDTLPGSQSTPAEATRPSQLDADMDEGDEDEDVEVEDAARETLLRDWIHNQSEHDDLMVINQPDVAIGQPGPGPTTLRARLGRMIGAQARIFDDEGNEIEEQPGDLVEEHPTAGVVIAMSSQLYETWEALFGATQLPENVQMDGSGQPDLEGRLYHPFASKLDWEVAQWMVSEGIGHGSFNRLLQIEEVRLQTLLLILALML